MTKSTGVGRGSNPASWNNTRRGAEQHRWNRGRMQSADGYVKLRVGRHHPLADPNGYVYEHLIVWCSAGRSAPARGFLLHHDNGDKTDNRLENLSVLSRAAHNRLHNAERTRDPHGRFLPLDGVQHDGMPLS